MELTFNYRLQAEAKGKTRLGREVLFLLEDTFPASVADAHISLATAKTVTNDIDGDFKADNLRKRIDAQLVEHCLRYQVVTHSVEITNYLVAADHPDIVVSFSKQTLTRQTSNDAALLYAYRLVDSEVPAVPELVQVTERDGVLALAWMTTGHIHGTRIYDGERNLLASLGEGVREWVHAEATEIDRLYLYDVHTYNANKESPAVRVAGRIASSGNVSEDNTEAVSKDNMRSIPAEGHMPSFQSGIGYGNDLLLQLKSDTLREESFTFSLQLKGYSTEIVEIYPRRLFRYRVQVLDKYEVATVQAAWRIGILDGAEGATDGGKKDVRLKLSTEIPKLNEGESYTIELDDPTGAIRYFEETMQDESFLVFTTNESAKETRNITQSHLGQKVEVNEPLTLKSGEKKRIEASIPSPLGDPAFKGKQVSDWTLVLNSDNPNVELKHRVDQVNYDTGLQNMEVILDARILNPTQTAWRPVVHSGHYYLNQAEHYLFGASRIRKRVQNLAEVYARTFVYRISYNLKQEMKEYNYSIELKASVLADGKDYLLSDVRVIDMIEGSLLEKNILVSDGDDITYSLSSDDPEEILLHVGNQSLGADYKTGCLYARTVNEIFIEDPDSAIFDLGNTNSVLLEPAPIPGSPIIVRDATGTELKQVHFISEDGQPSLDCEETLTSTSLNRLELLYAGVDLDTLTVTDPEGKPVTEYLVSGGVIHLYPSATPGVTYAVKYRLKRSFIAALTQDDAVRLTLHGAVPKEQNDVEVWYETSAEALLDVDINPLRTRHSEGFLYLSKEPGKAKKLEIQLGGDILYTERGETTTLRFQVLDAEGNPVSGERVACVADAGTVTLLQERTGLDGCVAARYVAPDEERDVQLFAFGQDAPIEATGTVRIREAMTPHRISLTTSHPTVYPQLNEIVVTAHVYGKDQEPIEGEEIEFVIPHSVSSDTVVETDAFGRAEVRFMATEIPRKGFIPITATTSKLQLKAEAAVRILGFRDYDPDRYVDTNNLIDIGDRQGARDNLGIYAGSNVPASSETFDLWLDQGDMLFLTQSYELRDVADAHAARTNLGLNVTATEPSGQWPNDIWFESEKE